MRSISSLIVVAIVAAPAPGRNSGSVSRNNTLVATNFFPKLCGTENQLARSQGRVDVPVAAKGELGVMRAKAGLIPVIAASLIAFVGGSLWIDSARAQETHAQETRAPQTQAPENCLAAPTGKTPAGSHWHYRTDPATQTKCWYLRTEGDAAQKPAAQDKHAADVAAPAPAAAAPKGASEQTGPEARQPRPAQAARAAPSGKRAQSGAPSGAQGGHQAGDRSAAWPDPPPQASGGNVTWPDPSQLAPGTAPQSAGPAQPTTAPLANNQQEPPPAQSADKATGNDAAGESPAAEPIATAASDGDEMPVGLLVALAISMLVAGILVRRIVKMIFARRGKVAVERREPVLRANSAGERSITLPVANQHDLPPGWVDSLDEDVQESLRQLLRTLEREAA